MKGRSNGPQPGHFRLDVWKDSIALAGDIFRHARAFPRQAQFSLGLQMQRSAVSVPSNIAEGAARGTKAEFIRFLRISRASLMELDTQIRIANDLELLHQADNLLERIRVLNARLNALIRSRITP